MSRQSTSAGVRPKVRGLGLIELMISMLIGLMVVGSAVGVFVSNQQTYRATEALARVQENARIGFELMAREIREAGGNPCGKNLPVANVLNNADAVWWSTWAGGVSGDENGAYARSASGTDAIALLFATSGGVTVTETPSSTSANFKVNTNDHGFEIGDILMVCDYSQASIFQATNVNLSNVTVVHSKGGSVSPGNCSKGLGLPVDCTSTNGKPKIYGLNSKIVEFSASRWYVADNNRGRSLYRIAMRNGTEQVPEEIVENVQDMEIEYLLRGANSYVDASPGLNWAEVVAVRITLSLVSENRVGTDGQVLQRPVEHVVTLRNRTS